MSSVQIVLVNYNGHVDTIECLETVMKSDFQDFTIWIIDNSPDMTSILKIQAWAIGEPALIDTKFGNLVYPLTSKPIPFIFFEEHQLEHIRPISERLILIKATENRGFAAANNIALRAILKLGSVGHVWILNNDTVISPHTLKSFINYTRKSNSSIGMIGGKLLEYKSPKKIQTLGCRYNSWTGKIIDLGKNQEDKGQWDNEEILIDYIVGASIFISIALLRDVGLLEEKYFLYFEEIDWAIRSKRRGWQLGFCSDSKIWHKGGSTIKGNGGVTEMMDFYYTRNRILLTKKFFPYKLPTLLVSFSWFIIRRISKGQWGRVLLLFKTIANPEKYYGD